MVARTLMHRSENTEMCILSWRGSGDRGRSGCGRRVKAPLGRPTHCPAPEHQYPRRASCMVPGCSIFYSCIQLQLVASRGIDGRVVGWRSQSPSQQTIAYDCTSDL